MSRRGLEAAARDTGRPGQLVISIDSFGEQAADAAIKANKADVLPAQGGHSQEISLGCVRGGWPWAEGLQTSAYTSATMGPNLLGQQEANRHLLAHEHTVAQRGQISLPRSHSTG